MELHGGFGAVAIEKEILRLRSGLRKERVCGAAFGTPRRVVSERTGVDRPCAEDVVAIGEATRAREGGRCSARGSEHHDKMHTEVTPRAAPEHHLRARGARTRLRTARAVRNPHVRTVCTRGVQVANT